MNFLKSTGIILAGFILTLVLTMGTDTFLESNGIFPTVAYQQQYGFNVLWMNMLAIAYRILYTILGGYVVAKLAKKNPMGHVMALGILGTVVAIVGNIAVSQIPAMAHVLPLWFMVALVLMAYPGVVLGGKLAIKKSKAKSR